LTSTSGGGQGSGGTTATGGSGGSQSGGSGGGNGGSGSSQSGGSGGASVAGGQTGSGGTIATGGMIATGGATGSGGQTGSGGASGKGGTTASGGATGSGGQTGSGGTTAKGGSGGGTGGTTGATGTGGTTTGTGGATTGTGGTATGTGGSTAPTCDESTIGTSPNTLGVDVTTAKQEVHKEIFGLLMEILGNDINNGIYVGKSSAIPNTNGIRNDIIEGFKEAGVGAIEWPGGCAANNYNWETNKNPSTTMGVDGFMTFATTVGAEPVLVGRPKPENAASNQKWIDYVNNNPSHPEWTVKYFKIGNEVWGCGGNLDKDEATYETWYNANYDVLNAPVNGKALSLVAGTALIGNNGWLDTMLGNIGAKISGVEIHDYLYFPDSYPCVGFSDNQYYDIVWRANEGQMAPRIKDIRTIMDKYDPAGRIKIIEDEWGDWLQNWTASDDWLQQGTVMDALSAALTLNMFMANADRIQMAGLAQAVNVIHSLFLTNSSSSGKDLVKTPTFYVWKMFVPHHTNNAKWAPNTLSSEKITGNSKTFSVLSSGATVNDAGQVSINLANVDLTKTHDVTITLTSSAGSYSLAKAEVITGPAKDSYNDFGKAETVNIQALAATSYQACGKKLKVTLPSKSVVMLTLDPK
jgi:alpha-N-arabinofuranosidase